MFPQDAREEMVQLARRILDELSDESATPQRDELVSRDTVRLARLAARAGSRAVPPHPSEPSKVVDLQAVKQRRENEAALNSAALNDVRLLANATLTDPLSDPTFDVDCVARELKCLAQVVLETAKSGLDDPAQLALPAIVLAQFASYLDVALSAGHLPQAFRRLKSL